MASTGPKALTEVTFRCPSEACKTIFKAAPARIEHDEGQEHHPWRYFSNCPRCKTESEQIHWEKSLIKAHAHATGPKTAAGILAVTKNLEGHPTPEETGLTRFNAMKHGLNAKVAKYFPARPGKYPQCDTCEYMNNGCSELTKACMKRAEVFMLHMIAYEEKDPRLLVAMNSELQASVRAIVNDIILIIARDGVQLVSPEWYYDKDGGFHLAQFQDPDNKDKLILIKKVQEHPLLKVLIDLMKANGMTLPDDRMTTRSMQENTELQGFLDAAAGDREQLTDYSRRSAQALEDLVGMIERSKQKTAQDPVLIEHQSNTQQQPAQRRLEKP